MPDAAAKPIEIEQLTKDEEKSRGNVSRDMEKNPDYPKEWVEKDLPTLVAKGFKYYKHAKPDGRTYMLLRHKRKDKGIGLYTEEKEQKLFHFFPNLETMGGIPKPPPWVPGDEVQPPGGSSLPGAKHSFLGMPITRVAVIPREYVPSINVIRYFQIIKENGFPGSFSDFINDIVNRHFEVCNGIKLPVMLEEEIEVRREENGTQTHPN